MKILNLIVAVLLMTFLISCMSKDINKEETDISEMKLKGAVKSIGEYSYIAYEKFGKIIKGKRDREFFDSDFFIVFDEKGNKIEENSYDSDGKLFSKKLYKYDKKGNEIEQSMYTSKGVLSSRFVTKYNEDGNKIEEKYSTDLNKYKKIKLKWRNTFKYNEEGKIIEENRYEKGEELTNKIIYKYNDSGNLTEKNRYDADGNPISKRIYSYDDQGNVVEYKVFEEGILDRRVIYKYENGLLNEKSEYNFKDILLSKSIYENGKRVEIKEYYTNEDYQLSRLYRYDDNENVIEQCFYQRDGSKYLDWHGKYDNKGNILESVKYDSFGQRWQNNYKYEYDKMGNFVKKIEFRNGFPAYIIERKIEYYK